MKGFLKILIAVFAVCLIAPAFSAVENVKVGGDIAVYGIIRTNFDEGSLQYGSYPDKYYSGLMQARVYVSADLSQNVSAMIRLISEFEMGDRWWYYSANWDFLSLDLAYIKVSDFLAPGLSITIGRQEIELGEGLVVGSQYNLYNLNYLQSYLMDLSPKKSFDAVKIDYAAKDYPFNTTIFYIRATNYDSSSDADDKLVGADFGFGIADVAKLDVYYVGEIDYYGTLHTGGLRIVSGIPAVPGLSLKLEGAKQWNYATGWALLAGLKYQAETNMKPYVKVNYARVTDTWCPVYPSNIGSRIGPIFYATGIGQSWGMDWGAGEYSVQALNFGFGFAPTEKWNMSVDGYWLDDLHGTTYGYEVDLGLEYKHTEDLTFGLTGGTIFGGNYFTDKPWQIIGYAKLAF